MTDMIGDESRSKNFLEEIIENDIQSGNRHSIVTRFPPEPNGFLHIGHAKSICLNFGLGAKYGGRTHLRFDDTNPTKEEQRYIDAIKEDIHWLGFDWGKHLYFASDYFEQLYQWAIALVEAGYAYVDEQSAEEIRVHRGTLTEPGRNSSFRDRPASESVDLLQRMREGEFKDGAKVLRAKIDMASANINLRDPVMYRILHATHPRTGNKWCIYPMYDWAHGQSDWIEGISHSFCTLEFEIHRPLYDWFIERLREIGQVPSHGQMNLRPHQSEFGKLIPTRLVMGKRKMREMVAEGIVSDWDDPRMPTLSGMRRRGYPAQAIREFCDAVGVSKRQSRIPYERLEYHIRQVLNKTAPRVMAVMGPLKVTITNWPKGTTDLLEAVNNPEDASAGTREVPFTGTLYIERDDFMEDPPRKFFRLAPGREVRLRYAYFITCNDVVKDADGNVTELLCTYDPQTRGGNAPDGRKVKATMHWVSAERGVEVDVRLYDHLFSVENPEEVPEGGDWRDFVNGDSLQQSTAIAEPAAAALPIGGTCQFERVGYFCIDPDSKAERTVFNRTVGLRDTWARMQSQGKG